jgi:hypothetical protein
MATGGNVDTPRARIFISCGQRRGSGEVQLVRAIADELGRMGFDPYVALERSTLRGVKESILTALARSEYFLFIDFKRERLFEGENGEFSDTGCHRGSLFSHQELGIATFLEMEGLFFRERGVRKDDGILQFIQANAFDFDDRVRLPKLVKDQVQERGWDPNWRRELVLERLESDFEDRRVATAEGKPARFFHIRVRNLHRRQPARNCFVYLETIELLEKDEVQEPGAIEFKWKGLNSLAIPIPPRKSRLFDAFWVFHDRPEVLQLGISPFLVDDQGLYLAYSLTEPWTYRLTFVVYSDDFAPARGHFVLKTKNRLDDITLQLSE